MFTILVPREWYLIVCLNTYFLYEGLDVPVYFHMNRKSDMLWKALFILAGRARGPQGSNLVFLWMWLWWGRYVSFTASLFFFFFQIWPTTSLSVTTASSSMQQPSSTSVRSSSAGYGSTQVYTHSPYRFKNKSLLLPHGCNLYFLFQLEALGLAQRR